MQNVMWKFAVFIFGIILGYCLIDTFDPEVVSGKRVLITGASAGIGEQLAYQYAKHGASVVITARREDKLREVIEKCREIGNHKQNYSYVVADMNDLDSIENVVQTATKTLGGLDIIVLNHVFYLPLGFWTGSKKNLTSIEKVMTVNFQSYVHLASNALPHLESSNGSIVVVSSFAAKLGQPYFVAYSSAKFALAGFFSALRQELVLHNSRITVTQCVLGLIDTKNALDLFSPIGLNALVDYAKPSNATDAAVVILKGGAKGVREVTFPWHLQLFGMLRDWIPETLESVQIHLYKVNKAD